MSVITDESDESDGVKVTNAGYILRDVDGPVILGEVRDDDENNHYEDLASFNDVEGINRHHR